MKSGPSPLSITESYVTGPFRSQLGLVFLVRNKLESHGCIGLLSSARADHRVKGDKDEHGRFRTRPRKVFVDGLGLCDRPLADVRTMIRRRQ